MIFNPSLKHYKANQFIFSKPECSDLFAGSCIYISIYIYIYIYIAWIRDSQTFFAKTYLKNLKNTSLLNNAAQKFTIKYTFNFFFKQTLFCSWSATQEYLVLRFICKLKILFLPKPSFRPLLVIALKDKIFTLG